MADYKEFLIACDKAEGEERAEYCILSVNVDVLKTRQAALVAAMAADGGTQHIAYSNGFRIELYNAYFPITGDDSPISPEAQDEYDGDRVAELAEGIQDEILEDEAFEDYHDETEVGDDRLLVGTIGVMAYTTLDDGATPVRSWTVTWDKLGLPYPKTP